jgi:hypothetical protein
MNAGWLHGRTCRGWVALLLFPALALRLMVPAGFMPSVGDGDKLTMQMCHGDAQSSVIMRLSQGEQPPGEHDAPHDAPCVFAASAATAPPPVAVVPLEGMALPEPVSPPRESEPLLRNSHRPQSPRAPPSLV